ncbi:MAG: hypothetical protein GXO64_03245 [Candidatus Micrarchaeota archaeon]|nr:hypothetical protein [Candidatus Micrarchaeota archaeon]
MIAQRIKENCNSFKIDFKEFVNPLFAIIKKEEFFACLQEHVFSSCKREFWKANKFVGNESKEDLASLKIYIDGNLLKDKSNICSGSEIRIEHEKLGKVEVDHIDIYGRDSGGCHNRIELGAPKLARTFLCAYPDRPGKPRDGGLYEIIIPYYGWNITYTIHYYNNPSKCRVYQESISVD